MRNFKTLRKKTAALTLAALIISACTTQHIGNSSSPAGKVQVLKTILTPAEENIEMQKAAYENYLKEQEQNLREQASYNVLTEADFKIGGFDTKANLAFNNPDGIKSSAVYIKVGTTFFTLTYEFMRKLRIVLRPEPAPPDTGLPPKIHFFLSTPDYNALNSANTVKDIDGKTSNYKPNSSEAAFVNLLKTMDSVTMPNFLQGYTAAGAQTNGDDGALAVNPGQVPNGYNLFPDRLTFISNAKNPPMSPAFYYNIWEAAGPEAEDSPFILTKAESDAIKKMKIPGGPPTNALRLPNSTELAFLTGITNQVTAPGVVLIGERPEGEEPEGDEDGPPHLFVQRPIDIEVGYGNNQVPGAFASGTQTALNIMQNVGMVNRNVPPMTANPDLELQVPALTPAKHQAGTNYAPAAVVLAAQFLLQGATDSIANNAVNPGSTDFFNSGYAALVEKPVLGSPVTFNNFHSVMRKIEEDNIDNPPLPPASATAIAAYDKMAKAGIKFAFSGATPVFELDTSRGLGKALNTDWSQTLIPKIALPAATQNQAGITDFLNGGGNTDPVTGKGNKRAVIVECSRAAAGNLGFSSNATNHAALVKFEILEGNINVLYIYDPGMPNNPLQPIPGISNYRPVTDAEKKALFASPVKLVGIEHK